MKFNENEIYNFKAIYSHDLSFVSEHWYKRDDYDAEVDGDCYHLNGDTYVFWKGHYQIYQQEHPVKIFSLYYDDELVDLDVMIDSSYVNYIEDLKQGDEISIRGKYVKIKDLKVRKRNQGIGTYTSKRKYLTDGSRYLTNNDVYEYYMDKYVKYEILPTKKAIKLK